MSGKERMESLKSKVTKAMCKIYPMHLMETEEKRNDRGKKIREGKSKVHVVYIWRTGGAFQETYWFIS